VKSTHGGKRPGAGRPKGVPNKRPIKSRDELWAYIDQQCALGKQANPFHVLVDTMMSDEKPGLRVTCAQDLADRLLPKLKAIEISGSEEHPLHLLLQRLDSQPLADVVSALTADAPPLRLPHETA